MEITDKKIQEIESISSEIETRYANILERLSNIGLVLVILGFVVYVFHILPLSISVQSIADNWGHSASDLAAKNIVHTGWSWVKYLPGADVLSLATIALLTMTPFFCLLVTAGFYLKHKDMAYSIITILQLVVLAIAVSGIFASGG